jgi:hypothetical protein
MRRYSEAFKADVLSQLPASLDAEQPEAPKWADTSPLKVRSSVPCDYVTVRLQEDKATRDSLEMQQARCERAHPNVIATYRELLIIIWAEVSQNLRF